MTTTTLTPTSTTAETPKQLIKKASTGENRSPTTPMQTSFGCKHIKDLLHAAREQATTQYTRIAQNLNKRGSVTGHIPKGGEKIAATVATTYLCLQCPNVTSTRERHRKEHPFAVESQNGFIFCHECKDFVYDPTFEAIRSNNGKKRKHSALHNDGDKRLVATNTSITPCAATGLRGLYNMGQTCFMSVILQAIIHNPLIRAYYLSEGHKSSECERDACTSCALDDIFTEFLGQEKHEGYGAVHMLQACWKAGAELAGYNQQDAHEYLGSFLNSLHAANTAEDEDELINHKADASKDCDCIIHRTFGGVCKSTVTCLTCKNVTTQMEHFMDIQLDLDVPGTTTVGKNKKIKLANGTTAAAANPPTEPMDLAECFERYTRGEKRPKEGYNCELCSGFQETIKKFAFACLPPVMAISFKSYLVSKSQASKIETKIRYPLSIDLTPYTASSSARSKDKSKANPKDTSETKPNDKTAPDTPWPIYELSSVIVHKGKMDTGHYISYSKQGDEWFRFDDSMVVQVGEKEVLGARAYMLFYVAESLGGE